MSSQDIWYFSLWAPMLALVAVVHAGDMHQLRRWIHRAKNVLLRVDSDYIVR